MYRGAGHSAGRTSWTAKPERDDYTSFVGFIVHYIHYLDPFRECVPADTKESDTTHQELDAQLSTESGPGVPSAASTTRATHAKPALHDCPVLLLGGYSYGAMITTQLEPLEPLLSQFKSPDVDCDAAHIRLRAQHLAEQQNTILGGMRTAMLQSRNLHSPTKRASAMRIGGDEGGSPRRSHDSHGKRSFSLDADDKLRRGVHDFMAKRKAKHHSHSQHWLHHRSASGTDISKHAAARDSLGDKAQQEDDEDLPGAEAEKAPVAEQLPAVELLSLRSAYFLVSPLQGLVNHLATMTLLPSRMRHQPDDTAEAKLVCNPTLAVYGDNDGFVQASKLRSWTAKLTAKENSQFRACEVASAGHFWVEEGALQKMLDELDTFAGSLIDDD